MVDKLRSFTSRFVLYFIVGLFFACASTPPPVYTDDQLYGIANEEIEDKNFDEGRQNLQNLEKLYPDSPHIADTRLAYADSYYKEHKYVDAIVQYQRFLDFHPRNKLADQAQYRMAMSYFQQIPNYERDQTFSRKAVDTFQLLLEKYPDSPLTSEAKAKIKILNKQLAENIFHIATFYYRSKAYEASIKRFRQVIVEYPQQSEIAEQALMYLAHSYLSLGSKAEAKALYRLFLKRFPESDYADDVEDYIGR